MAMKMKKYEELELRDDFMFSRIMSNPKFVKPLLETILGVKIRKIVYPQTQKTIDLSLQAKGIRLDVYVEDDQNTVFNLEMQTSDGANLPKRMRYYQGMIDLNILDKGQDYTTLKKSYVIFICTFDPFGRERYRYTFVETCREDGELLEDGICKIFLNTKGKIETGIGQELVRFLKWIGEPDAGKEKEENDLLITKLRTQITDLKKNRGMEENYMLFGEMLDEERRQGQKEGLQQGKMDILLKLLQEHKIDVKTAASIMGMNEDEFAKAVKECQEV